MKDKIVLVTGSTDGIGEETALELAKKGATVLIHGRDEEKCKETINRIKEKTDNENLDYFVADFSSLDEVRKLAERTTKATKEIASMITTIQKETSGAVESMEEGTKEVESGKELANQAGESLIKIIQASKSVVDVINQVASASEEQSTAAEQISKNIESISSVTQQSAAGTQQIARAAEDLNRLTENLDSLIKRFKIAGTTTQQSKKHQVKSTATVSDGGRLVAELVGGNGHN